MIRLSWFAALSFSPSRSTPSRLRAFARQGPPSTSAAAQPQLDQYKRNVGLEVDALQETSRSGMIRLQLGELGFSESRRRST